MIPTTVPNPFEESVSVEQVCEIAALWGLDPRLVGKVIAGRGRIAFDVWIFSGARDRETQEGVSNTPFDRSTHADSDAFGCPRLATGVDVQPVSPALRLSDVVVAQFGAAMVISGLRWGGGAPVTETGIPVGKERWHFDLGPRPH